MDNEKLKEIIVVLEELCDEGSVPKNIKAKFLEIVSCLNESNEVSIKVNKALQSLDEIGDDTNLQPYIRTQIWNIVSMLERVSA